MHSIVTNATWSSDRPVTSRIGDIALDHEHTCVLTDGAGVDPHECDCYVSRTRLVTTPVGDVLPTTEKDLGPELVFWHNEAERLQRRNNILWAGLILTSVTALIAVSGLAFELSLI